LGRKKKKAYENGFDRRDFFKFELAAGLVAGVPYVMPMFGVRSAFAKVGSNTQGIAPPTVNELADIAERYFSTSTYRVPGIYTLAVAKQT